MTNQTELPIDYPAEITRLRKGMTAAVDCLNDVLAIHTGETNPTPDSVLIEKLRMVREIVQSQHDDFSKHGQHAARIALRGIGEGLDEIIGDAANRKAAEPRIKGMEGVTPSRHSSPAKPGTITTGDLKVEGGTALLEPGQSYIDLANGVCPSKISVVDPLIDSDAFQKALPVGPDDEYSAYHLDEGNLRYFLARYLEATKPVSGCPTVSDEFLYEIIDSAGGQLTDVPAVIKAIRPYLCIREKQLPPVENDNSIGSPVKYSDGTSSREYEDQSDSKENFIPIRSQEWVENILSSCGIKKPKDETVVGKYNLATALRGAFDWEAAQKMGDEYAFKHSSEYVTVFGKPESEQQDGCDCDPNGFVDMACKKCKWRESGAAAVSLNECVAAMLNEPSDDYSELVKAVLNEARVPYVD